MLTCIHTSIKQTNIHTITHLCMFSICSSYVHIYLPTYRCVLWYGTIPAYMLGKPGFVSAAGWYHTILYGTTVHLITIFGSCIASLTNMHQLIHQQPESAGQNDTTSSLPRATQPGHYQTQHHGRSPDSPRGKGQEYSLPVLLATRTGRARQLQRQILGPIHHHATRG